MPKLFKTKISIPFTILFHKTLHIIEQLVFFKSRCFQRLQTFTYVLTKRKLNKKFPKVYISHGSQCDSTST